jgi:uncharacterized repeat protein (TIGR01451 family)
VYVETAVPAAHQPGKPLVCAIVVRNPGAAAAALVRVEDELPLGARFVNAEPPPVTRGQTLLWELGDLEPGAERRLTVTIEPPAKGDFESKVTATCAAVNTLHARIARPRLELSMAGPERATVGGPVQFQLTLSNQGPVQATHVVLHDRLPPGLQNPLGNSILADIGNLGPGEQKTVSLQTKAVAGGRQVNEASLTADGGLEATAQTAVEVEGIGALRLEAVDLEDPVEVGALVTYEIRVANQGTGTCRGVQVLATVPDGMTVANAQGPAHYRLQGQQVAFDPMPELAPRANAVFRVHARALKPGDWRFKVNLTSDQLQRPVYAEESTHVYDGGDGPRNKQP